MQKNARTWIFQLGFDLARLDADQTRDEVAQH